MYMYSAYNASYCTLSESGSNMGRHRQFHCPYIWHRSDILKHAENTSGLFSSFSSSSSPAAALAQKRK